MLSNEFKLFDTHSSVTKTFPRKRCSYQRVALYWWSCSFKNYFFQLLLQLVIHKVRIKCVGRYLAYANVKRLCWGCYVTWDQSNDPFHKCKFISMTDVNLRCFAALQLYKPEEYGIGINLQRLSDLKVKRGKIGSSWKSQESFSALALKCFPWFG